MRKLGVFVYCSHSFFLCISSGLILPILFSLDFMEGCEGLDGDLFFFFFWSVVLFVVCGMKEETGRKRGMVRWVGGLNKSVDR